MISRKTFKDIISLIIMFSFMLYFIGVKGTIDLFYQLLKLLNLVFVKLKNTSILSVMFKYCITFPISGFILMSIGSPRGTEGKIIGKIIYFAVGYIACCILDNLAQIIF